MNPKYMLDTNICIYLMRHHPPKVAERFAKCFVGDVVISTITLAELEYGVVCSGAAEAQNRAALNDFVMEIPVVAFDAAAASAYGPARWATRERKRDALDKLIASHALAWNIILVTNNEGDFATFPGLKVENWVGDH